MASHQILKGILQNFLGTYTSRYSDYEGYWVFGFLTLEAEQVTINLLNPETDFSENQTLAFAVNLAKRKFSEQLTKNNFPISRIREAHLEIKKLPEPKKGFVNGRASAGNDFRFTTKAASANGKIFEATVLVFIAPHNPSIESRSARAADSK
ncbi:MAG TPA: hypothetical protein VH255_04150 [Verrucomicrobiae bacterium]|jgi:hypothetical protein|nr:hypothetical protein [Verrucomicrobiae bacterium]